jgi:uncharacterized repeat protein (TIGR03803 family)
MSKLNCGNWMIKACGVFLVCATAAAVLPAQTPAVGLPSRIYTRLYSFRPTGGASPEAGLVQGTDGNFYGTTAFGGGGDGSFGAVFRITPSGTHTTLHSFDRTDGYEPTAPLVLGADGNFYGTTRAGGNHACLSGCGTVFQITSSGVLITLYNFCSQSDCTDGFFPFAGLVQGTDGNFYGTTYNGGAKGANGTAFKITPSGKLTTLHSFCLQGGSNCPDGFSPTAGLVQATDGNFYGTTGGGGVNICNNDGLNYGCGTVFKITPSGTLTTLHAFNGTDGFAPYAGVIQANDGDLYGTTFYGGTNDTCYQECGTFYKITTTGTLTTLYSFCQQGGIYCTDGKAPEGLVQATDGKFYGATAGGGSHSGGTAFNITSSGALTRLHDFCSLRIDYYCDDGIYPLGLIQGTDGSFYGTTLQGGQGKEAAGTTFSLFAGLGPFVETNPMSGAVGAPVNVLGTNLTGAASVTFNGVAAKFTVISSSLITATVPAGATSGTVQVVTPGGTLSSNVPFTVN